MVAKNQEKIAVFLNSLLKVNTYDRSAFQSAIEEAGK